MIITTWHKLTTITSNTNQTLEASEFWKGYNRKRYGEGVIKGSFIKTEILNYRGEGWGVIWRNPTLEKARVPKMAHIDQATNLLDRWTTTNLSSFIKLLRNNKTGKGFRLHDLSMMPIWRDQEMLRSTALLSPRGNNKIFWQLHIDGQSDN